MAGALKLAILAASLLCAAPALALTPQEMAALAFTQHPGARLDGASTLHDETGRTVTLSSLLAGKPAVLVFEYLHCPNLCGLVLGGLADALSHVPMTAGRDYRVLAISIDPGETPADAARAQTEYGARYPQQIAGWHFLTGDPATVRALADTVGFSYRWDESIRQFAHPAGVTLVGSDGTVSRYLLGLNPTPLDLRLGLADASDGRVASPATSLLLLCFGYDPAAGRYNVTIMQVTRLVGIATVGLLGLLIGGLVLADRRRR